MDRRGLVVWGMAWTCARSGAGGRCDQVGECRAGPHLAFSPGVAATVTANRRGPQCGTAMLWRSAAGTAGRCARLAPHLNPQRTWEGSAEGGPASGGPGRRAAARHATSVLSGGWLNTVGHESNAGTRLTLETAAATSNWEGWVLAVAKGRTTRLWQG